MFYVEITNWCTKGYNFECKPVAGRQTVITPEISAVMTDNSDGTYSYSYTVNRPGKITVSVYMYTQGGVYNEYYPNNNYNVNNGKNNITSTLNFDWGSGNIYGGVSDDVSAKYFFIIKAPVTGTYTFYARHDDIVTFKIDGSLVLTGTC